MKTNVEKITEYKNQFSQLCHASNILKKFEDGKKLNELNSIAERYIVFLESNLKLTGYSDAIIKKRVGLLNDYYNFIHENNYDNLFTSQSKFRPTVLEEFLFLLFKDFVLEYQNSLDAQDHLDSGNVKAYSNLFIKAKSFEEFVTNPEIAVNEKDQDFAIYRKFVLSINEEKKVKLQVPAIAIEAKTFIDKTMLDGIIAAAEKVKSGNPYSMFISVTETYDVAFGVDPAYSRIDQIYVLRKTTRKAEWSNIAEDVVLRMFHEVKAHLERPWSDVRTRLMQDGVII